jgi:hypothetical protein
MAQMVRVYVKKQLRLEKLTVMQKEMYALGNAGLASIVTRVSSAKGSNDQPAAPLKESWRRIKLSRHLKPVRDLRGTGMMWPKKSKAAKPRKPRLQNVGHLLDQIKVRAVSDYMARIEEPTTRAGRIKARAHRDMLLFSPKDKETVRMAAQRILNGIKNRLINVFPPGAWNQR